jgi:hypothetical protein
MHLSFWPNGYRVLALEDKSLTTMADKLLRYWKMDVF